MLAVAAWALMAAGKTTTEWRFGPPTDPDHFPIGVWLQAPKNAVRYREAGINFYLALWRGPTQEQLDELTRAGMPVICGQNAVGLANRENPIIIGWMHQDEPDNAQSLGEGKGWGPPVPPSKVWEDYAKWRAADPTRPVLLNLGQGVANDNWRGRGSWGKKEDYPEYVKGCDIVSYDVYPVADRALTDGDNLWLVAEGVDRLRAWTNDERIVWNIVEASRIGNVERKVSPAELRAEVWMSLIHGSRGIVYFVHQFEPHFVEASLLEDANLLAAVTALNAEVRSLARVLNTGESVGTVSVASSAADVPIDALALRSEGALYVFAVGMRQGATTSRFSLRGIADGTTVEALNEGRSLTVEGGGFSDDFASYGVHLYRIDARP
ncbi:hypothetical protein FJZ36_04195 [Candidatus Poribacteria bacterium]|nr:hypothetical protein [Candidatus Poribacteria bacterium]